MASNFYVHIIESPSPEELLSGITEGRALCSFLDIARIPYLYNLAVNPTQFCIAMNEKLEFGLNQFNLPPILHLSTHGGVQGIQLTSQREFAHVLTWAELASYIRPIYKRIGFLGVCMSCCEGANAMQMAAVMNPQDIPFTWIIGSFTKIDLRDAALAFAVFYRRFHSHSGKSFLYDSLEAMKAASGISDFSVWFGDLTQEGYSQAMLQNSLPNLF